MATALSRDLPQLQDQKLQNQEICCVLGDACTLSVHMCYDMTTYMFALSQCTFAMTAYMFALSQCTFTMTTYTNFGQGAKQRQL